MKNIRFSIENPVFQAWFCILDKSPTKAWEQPVLTFIDSFGKAKLSDEDIDQCNFFMCNLARYIYAKHPADEPDDGLTIKQEMLRATEIAKQGKIYKPKIKVTKQFEQRLSSGIPKKLQWGFCAVVEFSRNFDKFIERTINLKPETTILQILETTTVEQIFPDNWEPDPSDPWHEVVHNNEPDGWNDRKIRKTLKTIGNLILIEQDIHQNTTKICKGNFFGERKNPEIHNNYRDSIFGEVLFISLECHAHYDISWSYSFYMYRQRYSIKRLIDFFSGINKYILR
ncbi:MAG: DUF1524 domain-containing protein [Planctomycetaceae bacterium]|nr:DUF1524 domain-containing protein [Planctomycetaceae bacterium]